MASKIPPPSEKDRTDALDDDDDEEEEEEDEDYDEDDDEFTPGGDDYDEQEDEEEHGGTSAPLLDGILSIDPERILHYRGEGFHLVSTQPVQVNLIGNSITAEPAIKRLYTVVMKGPCDIESVNENSTIRTMEMTWSLQDARDTMSSHSPIAKNDEGKKAPARYYGVYGKEIDCVKGECLELQGGYAPSVQDGKEAVLVCQGRIIPTHQQQVASPAAAASAVAHVDNEDEDEADDGVDYEELMALHEDAGLTVEDLRKRYQSRESANSQGSPSKRIKAREDDVNEHDDDDGDEDYCF